MSRRILYISYDGMTDPLGDSQVLSYLIPLSKAGFEIDLISYEKPDRFSSTEQAVRTKLAQSQIEWHPLTYHQRPPIIGTLIDLLNGWRLIKQKRFHQDKTIVHCRGYISSILGLRLKRKFDTKFIFDMRGWWPDEKKESGFWNGKIYDGVYRFFKNLELKFLQESDTVVSLTENGKQYMINYLSIDPDKIGVVPTCVDLSVFPEFDSTIKTSIRTELSLSQDDQVLLYSGSLGANYPPTILVELFNGLKTSNGILLIVTRTDHQWVRDQLSQEGITEEKFRLVSADRADVHRYIMASDIGIIFYRPAFSIIGRNPTKLSEYWACGVPAIGQHGVGDLNDLSKQYRTGLSLFEINENNQVLVSPSTFQISDKAHLRTLAVEYGSLEKGVTFYSQCYQSLATPNLFR